jgi:hypothetical protein
VAAILVGVAEMAAKEWKGLGVVLFGAPFAAGDIEETGSVDDVIADANDGGFARCIVASGREADANVELSEEGLDWSGWIPRGLHSELVGVEFVLRDFAVVSPEVGKEGETGDVSVSEGRIVQVLDVVIGDGVDDLSTEGFVDFVVGAEDGASSGVNAIELRDLMSGETCGMLEDGWWVVGGKKRDGGEKCIVGGGEGEGDMAMEAIAAVGGDGGSIGIELGLSGAEGGIGWRVSGRGDGSEFEGREGGSDDTGGEGEGRHVINFY